MASSAAVQSILGSSATCLTGGSRVNQLSPAKYVTMSKRYASLRVRATAEEENVEQSPDSPTPKPKPQAIPKPAPKVSTKFTDVLAFSGPGPERINGRLAMVGFVSAIAVELANGNDLVAQISNGGVPWFLGTSVLLSLASLIPLFKGVTAESRSGGIMSSDAELWNGRLAMLGLIALAFTEYVKGGTLV